MLKFNYC